MSVRMVEQIRRQWQPLLAVVLGALMMLLHLSVFLPLERRLASAESRAHTLGVGFDPDSPPATMPPRVVAVVSVNTLSPAEAQSRGSSGALTADLFDVLTSAANRAGVSVLATDPGVTLQQDRNVLVKAHLRAACDFAQYVRFLDALAHGDPLLSVDRFTLVEAGGNRLQLELWVTRTILKRAEARP